MMTALQTLIDNGCSEDVMKAILGDILECDSFEDDDDKRCCIAMLFDYEQGNRYDPDGYSISGNSVVAPNADYLVLDDDEADEVCKEYIKDSLGAFNTNFLSVVTGIDRIVFEVLSDKYEGANDAIRSIIDGSCGIDEFVKLAISDNGRGFFLNHCDEEEFEVSAGSETYYVYQVY